MKYEKEIEASHPVMTEEGDVLALDLVAMELVGERDSKRDLVNLVRWLLMGGVDVVKSDMPNSHG